MEVGLIKSPCQPAVNSALNNVLKTANKQFKRNKRVSRSYQNLPRHDICDTDAAVKTTKYSKKFIKIKMSSN